MSGGTLTPRLTATDPRARLVAEIKWDGMVIVMEMGMKQNRMTTPFPCLVWQGMECLFYSFFLFNITKSNKNGIKKK